MVGPDKPQLVAVHSFSGAYLRASGIGAVVAGKRDMVGESVLGQRPIFGNCPTAALVVDHAAKALVGPVIMIVLAGHNAGSASGAASVIEVKSLRHGLKSLQTA